MDKKDTPATSLRVKTDKETLARWKKGAIQQEYMNFSQFVRDAIEEKIKRFEKNLT